MQVNGKVIYRSAADERWHVQGDGVAFDTQIQAVVYCETGQSLTETEAKMAMQKLELAKAIIWQTQRQAATMDEGPDVLQEYFDSNVTFADEDVAALGVTAAQVTACLTLLENVGKFYAGNTPVNAAYRVTVNAVRRVDTQ